MTLEPKLATVSSFCVQAVDGFAPGLEVLGCVWEECGCLENNGASVWYLSRSTRR
jgi:hypothetical protein